MYTSYTGKKLLRLYNERENKNYSAREFFDEVFFEVFFEDESHLLHVGNSAFFQKPKEEDVKRNGGKALAQLDNLHNSILNDPPNMSIYVGYGAKDLQGTTSGQLTTIDFGINNEEMYASWIGAGLGIGISGGFVMLIDDDEVLWALYEGWGMYREFLRQTPTVKDKQIETWNGHWICHRLSKRFDASNPQRGFRIETAVALGKIAIPTNEWVKVVFALAHKYPKRILTAYCYNLSQTNTTLGFINIYLPQAQELFELRDAIFINESTTILDDGQIEDMETFFNFRSACKMGTIGLKALEPDKLRTYMPKGSVDYAQGKDFKFTDDQSFKNFQLYKLWIIAMLNKTELLKLAEDVAAALRAFEKKAEKGKADFYRTAQQVRESNNLRNFIERLTEVLEKSPEASEIFKHTIEQVLKMPSDNFPLFITLVRFEYQYLSQKSSIETN
jgi:hypothetical protein